MFGPTSKYCGEFGCMFKFYAMLVLGSFVILPLLGITAYYSIKSRRLTKQKLGRLTILIILTIILTSTALFLSINFNALDESTRMYAAKNPLERAQIYDVYNFDVFVTIILFAAVFIIVGLFLFKLHGFRNTLMGSGALTLLLGILVYGTATTSVSENFNSMIVRAVLFVIISILIIVYAYYSIKKE